MRLVVAGCGTTTPDPARGTSCFVVEAGTVRMLLDCGPGSVHGLVRAGVQWSRLTHVGITHFHLDHIGDLPYLFYAWKHGMRPARSAPLTLFGPDGMNALLAGLPAELGATLREAAFPLEVRELHAGGELAAGELRIRACATPHTDASLAYRIEGPEASIGFTGDTAPDDALGIFLRGVDVLVAECTVPDGDPHPSHLRPSNVAALASSARPRCLVLTHVGPDLDLLTLPARVRDAGWAGDTRIAHHGLRLDVPLPRTA